MSIHSCSVKTISRAKGRSAVAHAAYCVAGCLRDDCTGEVYNYRKKSGVVLTRIVLL